MEVTMYEMIKGRVDDDQSTECWLWEGSTIRGYGCLYSPIRKGTVYAHIVAYRFKYGIVPYGYELDHKCRIPLCWNPHHLEVVTHKENVRRGMVSDSYIRSEAGKKRWQGVKNMNRSSV